MTNRHPRRPDLPRPASLSRRVSRKALAELRAESADHPGGRPRTRGECADGPRPCPWVSCQHHLYLEVSENGTVKLNFPGLEIEELPETCALDVADRGGLSLEDVGPLINVTRERIRQIELSALAALPRDQLQELHDGEGARGRRHLPVLPPAPPKPPRPVLTPPPVAPSGYVPRRGAHNRAAILALLEHGPRRLWELADGSSSYQVAISRQLRRLLAQGVVERIALGVYALRPRSAAE